MRSLPRLLPLFISLLLASMPAAADRIADLRALLTPLSGKTSVRATVSVESSSQQKEGDTERDVQGRTSLTLEDGPAGLSVTYPRAELARAEQEELARQADPEKTTPTQDAIQRLDASTESDYMNYAPVLLRELQKARVTQDLLTDEKGAVRLVALDVPPRLSAADKKHVKSATTTVKLWLGRDGLPLAATRTTTIKASFLLITFENDHSESLVFSKIGDRLTVTHDEQEDTGSGLGQHFHSSLAVTLTAVALP